MEEKRIIINDIETDYTVSSEGKVYNTKTGRELKGSITPEGYKNIQLSVKSSGKEGKKLKCILLHKLVAKYFVDNPNNATYVKHINGNLLDNRSDNLCWSDDIHSYSTGQQYLFTSKNVNSKKYSIEEVMNNPDTWQKWPKDSRYYVSINGEVFSSVSQRILSKINRGGYERVSISGKRYSVHRMVYETFCGLLNDTDIIDHINGVKNDNRLENLRKVNQSENMYNAQKLGHKGQKKVAQYDKDNNFIKEWASLTTAAKEFGVTYAAIASAARRGGTSCGYYWKFI